jgi:hypothetical protein
MNRSQLRNDLLERIKERHDRWLIDALELYLMAELKTHEAVGDVLTVVSYQTLRVLDRCGMDIDEYIDGLKAMRRVFKKIEKNRKQDKP